MVSDREVRVRTWTRGSAQDERDGLLGFVMAEYGDLVLDGITVRRTAEGRLALSFPARTDKAGRKHAYVRPIDDAARQEIEREVMSQLVASLGEVADG